MHLLGRQLADHKPLRYALRAFYGISHERAGRLLARLSIPEHALVSSLTEGQVTALSSYLSAPGSSASPAPTPCVPPHASAEQKAAAAKAADAAAAARSKDDPLNSLLIESDLRRARLADINHHAHIGSYVGRRHSMKYPVRGQGTRTNAMTARRLNSLRRRRFS